MTPHLDILDAIHSTPMSISELQSLIACISVKVETVRDLDCEDAIAHLDQAHDDLGIAPGITHEQRVEWARHDAQELADGDAR